MTTEAVSLHELLKRAGVSNDDIPRVSNAVSSWLQVKATMFMKTARDEVDASVERRKTLEYTGQVLLIMADSVKDTSRPRKAQK